jgi:hypothetical protein
MAHKINYAPPGMFEITKPLKKKEELDTWMEHFKKKKIKTEIVQDKNGRFILCCEGIEAKL